MRNFVFLVLIGVFSSFTVVNCNYHGPFILWGLNGLNGIKNNALNVLDDKLLRDFYAKAGSIVVFLKNATTKLDELNFPSYKQMVNENEFIYLTQDTLTSDPLDYNANAEVINLVGDGLEQDTELTALYKDATMNYGEGNVLGILASRFDLDIEHRINKRQATPRKTDETTEPNPTDEIIENNYIYKVTNKSLLWTGSAPELKIVGSNKSIELVSHNVATADTRTKNNTEIFFMRVGFVLEDKRKTFLKFQFTQSFGWWSLNSVELEYDDDKFTLQVVGKEPSAPLRCSYSCANQLIFKNSNFTVTLKGIQVQPYYTKNKFGINYDCVGFFTAPIWAGIFISFLLMFVLTIALTAISEIKPPNRFENKSGKQLTFTVQE